MSDLKFRSTCAIKECGRPLVTKRVLQSNEFAVCIECERAIVIGLNQKMEDAGLFERGWTLEYSRLLARFRRERGGLTVPRNPLLVVAFE